MSAKAKVTTSKMERVSPSRWEVIGFTAANLGAIGGVCTFLSYLYQMSMAG